MIDEYWCSACYRRSVEDPRNILGTLSGLYPACIESGTDNVSSGESEEDRDLSMFLGTSAHRGVEMTLATVLAQLKDIDETLQALKAQECFAAWVERHRERPGRDYALPVLFRHGRPAICLYKERQRLVKLYPGMGTMHQSSDILSCVVIARGVAAMVKLVAALLDVAKKVPDALQLCAQGISVLCWDLICVPGGNMSRNAGSHLADCAHTTVAW